MPEPETGEETRLEEETILDETSEDSQAEDTLAEDTPEVAEEETPDEVAALHDAIAELKAQLAEQASKIEELTSSLAESSDQNKKLSALVKGEEALSEGDGDTDPAPTILDQFQSLSGAEQHDFWKQNKPTILKDARRA